MSDQRPVYEAHGVEFRVVGGDVRAKAKSTGCTLPESQVTNLLLLDIAQTLMDIKCWGIAMDSDGGQRTYER